jgi:hypothetical protein
MIALVRVLKHAWWFSSIAKGAILTPELKNALSSLTEEYTVLVNPEDLL